MIGAIVGDIVGSRFEFNNFRNKDFELFTSDCKVTDDSIMTLAVASCHGRPSASERAYRITVTVNITPLPKGWRSNICTIGRRYPNCGYGSRFILWVFSDAPQPYNSFGNGRRCA